MDSFKNYGKYVTYTYIQYLQENGITQDVISFEPEKVAPGTSPTYPSDPSNPFSPGDPRSTKNINQYGDSIGNITFEIYYDYTSAQYITFSSQNGYFVDDNTGSYITQILNRTGGQIHNYGWDSNYNYARLFIDCGDQYNILLYSRQGGAEFNGITLDGVIIPVGTSTQLSTGAHIIVGDVSFPKYLPDRFSYGSTILNTIQQGQTCLQNEQTYVFDYVVYYNDGNPYILGMDYGMTRYPDQTTTIMPFIAYKDGTIMNYYCYTANSSSSGIWNLLSNTYIGWTNLHRQGDYNNLYSLIESSLHMTKNDYFDCVASLAKGIDPGL